MLTVIFALGAADGFTPASMETLRKLVTRSAFRIQEQRYIGYN